MSQQLFNLHLHVIDVGTEHCVQLWLAADPASHCLIEVPECAGGRAWHVSDSSTAGAAVQVRPRRQPRRGDRRGDRLARPHLHGGSVQTGAPLAKPLGVVCCGPPHFSATRLSRAHSVPVRDKLRRIVWLTMFTRRPCSHHMRVGLPAFRKIYTWAPEHKLSCNWRTVGRYDSGHCLCGFPVGREAEASVCIPP